MVGNAGELPLRELRAEDEGVQFRAGALGKTGESVIQFFHGLAHRQSDDGRSFHVKIEAAC
jgi:hypothetical protein